MVQDLIPGTLIALAIAFPIHSSPVSSVQPGYQAVYETAKSPSVTVQKDDSLGSIAAAYYGDSAYWTTLWNDNDWIEDPSLIEAGMRLSIREQEPEAVEVLKAELLQKIVSEREAEESTPVTPAVEVRSIASSQPVAVASPQPQPVVSVTPQPAVLTGSGPLNAAQIQFLGSCEAGMDPAKNTGNGYYGAFQFSYGTWKSMGTAYERADMAPLDVQIDAVQRLLQRSSIFTQFPACARKMKSLGII